jgi:glutaredoxin
MNRRPSLRPLLLLLCAASAQAQLYKWVGPDGKVTYSDTPPPPAVKRVETRTLAVGDVNTADFPYELAEAARKHPVTLYSTANCAPCDEGRSLLQARGIPFAEKTVAGNEDIVRFRKINSEGSLPFLVIGAGSQRGFESSQWDMALTAAGYPASSRLPKTYRNPPAQALAARPPVPAANRPTGDKPAERQPEATELPPATGKAPPGFRF